MSIGWVRTLRLRSDTWEPLNPQAEAEQLETLPHSRYVTAGMAVVGRVWAKQDPLGALSFAETLNPCLSDTLTENVMQAWGGTRPEEARTYVADHPKLYDATKRGFAMGAG
ncbi:MAG: hypothetical protein ACI8T1_003079 [Verrucomicrobiales bacterium]